MLKVFQKTRTFFNTYFEPFAAEGLSLHLLPYQDAQNKFSRLREKTVETFGRPGLATSNDWILPPGDFQRAIDFIVQNHPAPKLPLDPVWLSFTCDLSWKRSALPSFEEPDELNESENNPSCGTWKVGLSNQGRIMFLFGMVIPISSAEPASYEFLQKFSADAPFKMNPKRFRVAVSIGAKKNLAFRKPDTEILARLKEVIG